MFVHCWGITFYFVWLSVISNPEGVDEMTSSLFFNVVSCTVYAAPIFFFCSGFLQTFALMQDSESLSGANLVTYILRKLLRYVPLNMICVLTLVWMLPYLGSGPIWNDFHTLVEPCKTKWWTNLVWINNFYPAEYDDRCLPFTWFVPVYVQLSVLLPIVLLVYKSMDNKLVAGIIYLVMIIASLGATFALVYSNDVGGTIAVRRFEKGKEFDGEKFYAHVWSNPIYHFSSFYYGMILCLVYLRFREERAEGSAATNSFSSRLMESITYNSAPRYILYLLGVILLIGSVLW